MVVIRVFLKVKASLRNDFLIHMNEQQVLVPNHFSGCDSFRVFQDTTDESQFVLYEEWENEDALAKYKESQTFQHNSDV